MKPRDSHRRRLCGGVLAAVTFAGACLVCGVAAATPASSGTSISSTGPAAGQIKHVWLIILENKSYDATFSGLNQNNYLWQTLPR
ncbi:MAG: hypothetical protein FWF28_08600, partial [Micrococcales bacterium]|nr:hypothetical protein [Micrococcales bacterium]